MSDSSGLTLSTAIKTKRLQEFIAREEARGVSPANLKEFQDLAARLIKDTPQEDQTSRSGARDRNREAWVGPGTDHRPPPAHVVQSSICIGSG